ncbi:MAG: virulence protein RhuM/Fic/DOC family protein [Candidatus Cloacimonetes bacterium]|nr:virulence protein RhuM/Fic/DOC family protein [Candidatus Cloacimonadota bacterium]
MENNEQNIIEIFQSKDNKTEVKVVFQQETAWLTQVQMAELFDKDRTTINRHINNIFKEGELDEILVCAFFAHTTKHGAIKGKTQSRKLKYYNLDVVISVGYRIKSQRGVQFRQWATQRLKDYLIKGYAINEKRLEQKKQEVLYLKTGIRILNRAIEEKSEFKENKILEIFAKGLELLDNYDHKVLDKIGNSTQLTVFPMYDDYIKFISEMYSDYESGVFAKPKDDSFHSSINHIKQTFSGKELYPSIQEKAANLLYSIVKNHSFVDGNKRIAAACFLYFLNKNRTLFKKNNKKIISNGALASLTLFIATSNRDEADIIKQLIISILNRNDDDNESIQ